MIDGDLLLEQFGLAQRRRSPFAGLSGGERQRLFLVLALVPVAIAIAVIDLPRVLFAVGILYALSGPVMWAVQRLRKKPEAA